MRYTDADIQKYRDSLLVTAPGELTAVSETFNHEYRGLEWRNFLPVKSDLPEWAKSWQVYQINGLAPSPQLLNELAPNQLPQPSLQRAATTFNLFEFLLGYSYTDSELVYAFKLGLALEQLRANAVGQSFEEFFEVLAATGAPFGSGIMETGLLNQPTGGSDAQLLTELPKAAGAGNAGWFDLSSSLATATALEMAKDCVLICDRIESNTLNRNKCTNIVMADPLWEVFNNTVQGVDNTRTARQIFAELRPNVNVSRWYKANGAGASGRHRICGYDASDPQGPRMVTVTEPSQLAPHRVLLGWQVPIVAKTGGVVVYKKQTMAYMDPVNQA